MDGMLDGNGMLWGIGWNGFLIVTLGILALAALTKHLFFNRER